MRACSSSSSNSSNSSSSNSSSSDSSRIVRSTSSSSSSKRSLGLWGFSAVRLLLQQLRKLLALGSRGSNSSSSNSSSSNSSSSSSVGLQPLLVDAEALLKDSPCLVRMAAAAAATAAAAAAAGGAAAAEDSAAASAAAGLPKDVGPYFQCLLSRRQVERHGRQLLLASWGVAAQRRLSGSRLLLVGAGGLGGPIALYLIGAGIAAAAAAAAAAIPQGSGNGAASHLTISDGDSIDTTNLHRQVFFREADVGRPKSLVLAEACRALDSQASVVAVEAFVDVDSALRLVESHDIVVDATDSRATRYLLNDACVLAGKPLVCGSALRAEGQAAVFNWMGGPCYRCLFPPEEAEGPSESKGAPNVKDSGACDTHGVLGPVPALIGLMQAAGVGRAAVGRAAAAAAAAAAHRSRSCILVAAASAAAAQAAAASAAAAAAVSVVSAVAALQIAGATFRPKEISSGAHMQIYDAFNSTCGDNPAIKALQARPEYAETCWYPTVPSARQMGGPQFAARLAALGPLWQQPVLSLEALLLRQSLKAAAAAAAAEMLLIVDVRPATQFAVAHLPYSLHWPLESLLSYTAKRQQKAAAAAAAGAAATATAAHHEEACAFLKELLGCTYTPGGPKPQQTSIVFVCRRGRDSAIATEALHALLASSAKGAPSSGMVGAPQHGGPPPLEGPLKMYNLGGGLEALVRQGLISMPVP
ncbi:hypothetical protein Emag_002557 [Eimeria magna]